LCFTLGFRDGRQMTMHTHSIPSTGEPLPVIGCGTYRGFDVPPDRGTDRRLQQVLDALFAAGGSVIDSSPMCGRAEAVTGDLLAQSNAHAKAFIATKVWTRGRDAGIAQMEESFKLMKTDRIDLMQIHNLVDWRTHLPVLRQWKDAGRIRYLGVTHYTASAFADLEAVMRAEPLDFVQLNYSAVDRAAERRLLPLAIERGIAVIVNYPLASGAAVRGVSKRPLPDWVAEIDCTSWSQLLLKFVVSHPAITCAIPGTGNSDHMADNARAGTGKMPDEAMRVRIASACEG
jgi:diketogulonate reductase-like aldo/keto reductase